MRDAFVEQLTALAENDPDVMFVTGDLGFGVFDDFAKRFPKQYLNVGVAEQNMTGVAAGLALEGKKVFTYSIANFATLRCLEQIRNDAAYHNANITVVASGGGFTYGSLGMSHHATEDLAIMRALPNVTAVAPCTAWETKFATEQLCKTSGVGYLRIEKGGDKNPPADGSSFVLGKAIKVAEGTDITLIVIGGVMSEAVKAAAKLKEQGVSAAILSMHTIKPIDDVAIQEAVEQTGAIVTIEEHNVLGGLASAVAEVLMSKNLSVASGQIGLQDQYSAVVGDQDYLRKFYKMDADAITQKVHEVLAVKRKCEV